MKQFKTIDEIIQYARDNGLRQIFKCPSMCDETKLIGSFKDAEVRIQHHYGYLEVIGLDEEDTKYLDSKLGNLFAIKND